MAAWLTACAGSLVVAALAHGAPRQGSLRELHHGTGDARPTGLLLRDGVLEIYGRRGLLSAWDLERATPVPADAVVAALVLGERERLIFAALDRLPALAGWERSDEGSNHPVVAGEAGRQKTLRLGTAAELAIVLSADGRTAAAHAVGLDDAPSRTWILADLPRAEIRVHQARAPIEELLLSAGGSRVLVRGGGRLSVHDRRGTERIDLGRGDRGWISPDGGLTAVLREGSIVFHEGARELAALRVQSFVAEVEFAEEARIAAVADGRRVVLLDLDAGREIDRLDAPGDDGRVHSLAITPDGGRLAAGGIEHAGNPRSGGATPAFVLHLERSSGTRRTVRFEVERWSLSTPGVRFLPKRPEVLVRLPLSVSLYQPED